MHCRRVTGLIALVAMTLSLGEGLAAGVCVDDREQASEMAAHSPDHGLTYGAGDEAALTDEAQRNDETSCPLSAMMTSCGGLAAAPGLRVTVPAAVVANTQSELRTFLVPASPAGTALFHPPRA